MKKAKRWMILGLVWMLLVPKLPVFAQAPKDTQLYAKAAVLMDAASGRVLYEKNGEEILAMASTTKILTCILALEYAKLDEIVEVSAYATTMPKVKLNINKGEQYYLKDLLYSLMLESHNDVAVAIAEHIGKNYLEKEIGQKAVSEFSTEESKAAVAAFADLMNEKARELGCENSWFITPNGLDATETFSTEDGSTLTKNHSTTATELAKIMSYCVLHSPKKEEFLTITQAISYSMSSLEGRNFFLTNHNAFLAMMEGVISGKTGFTNQAGYCYVGALERDGRTYVVALLACGWPNNKSYKWSDAKKLMQHGIEDFAYKEFDRSKVLGQIPDKIAVQNGQTFFIGQQAFVGTEIVEIPAGDTVFNTVDGVLMAKEEQPCVTVEMAPSLEAPVNKGDVVGRIVYEVDGICYKTEEIRLTADVKKIDFEWCIRKVAEQYIRSFCGEEIILHKP